LRENCFNNKWDKFHSIIHPANLQYPVNFRYWGRSYRLLLAEQIKNFCTQNRKSYNLIMFYYKWQYLNMVAEALRIPPLRGLRQKDWGFKATLVVRPCLKKQQNIYPHNILIRYIAVYYIILNILIIIYIWQQTWILNVRMFNVIESQMRKLKP
jgi:hypothetical protein